ncbi:hypothetical protein AWH49_10280 [Domibacillus aminovorans]|uniref:Uncharacterized protein n=2 Tax=Domibacillus aminovorans TaxID=29332 RepID=A0A177LAM6_9BACI|nr:hypothetical protein AWH49_10280 [Domibacillus aminovorans]
MVMNKEGMKTAKKPAFEDVQKALTAKETLQLAKQGISSIKEEKEETHTNISISLPSSLNEKVEDIVIQLKRQGVTKYDAVTKKDRKISKSSWIIEAIQEKMRRDALL